MRGYLRVAILLLTRFALFVKETRVAHGNLDLDTDGSKITTKVVVNLWFLADKLAVRRLQNRAIDLLHAIYKRDATISTVCLRNAYENTTAGSTLRRFFVNQCTYGLGPQLLQQDPHHFPQEMLLEFAMATRSLVKTQCRAPNEDAVIFHVAERE